MATFPAPPTVAALASVTPAQTQLPAGTPLARVYFTQGPHPVAWNTFRHFGPTGSRFDHHLPSAEGEAHVQERSVLYTAGSYVTCLAECFQGKRLIDRARSAPWVVVFNLERDVTLLNVRDTPYLSAVGLSTAISAGHRGRARQWARAWYDAYPELDGLWYGSSMDGYASAIALTNRARDALPTHPRLNRALADDTLIDLLKAAAHQLRRRLR